MTAASAKGLFRATGKKSKPTLRLIDDGFERVDDSLEREKDDFVWDKKHEGETVLRMLDRADARQHELFGAA